jgi:prepilin peptidase CpaA
VPVCFSDAAGWFSSHGNLVIPLVLTVWIAWGDLKTRRIPNYLTLTIALGGLAFSFLSQGLLGLGDGFSGMAVGLGLLILPYLWGGMGAGDVKALAALGAWLGFWGILVLFCYMALAGGIMALATLWWNGQLWTRLRQGWMILLNWILCRAYGNTGAPVIKPKTPGIPYGVAFAAGMAMLVWRGI